MRFSIESRVPFLDVDFVNFALSLRGQYHISKDGEMKHLFREAMKDILPAAIFQRKDKVGFHTPGGELLIQAAPWVENILQNISPELREIINVNDFVLNRFYFVFRNDKRAMYSQEFGFREFCQ